MITPREYLSYSQLILFEKDPKAYIEQYVYNKKRGTNRGMAIGKSMATALEDDEATGDPVLDLVISRLPKFDLMDVPTRCEIKIGKEIVPILIRPDTCNRFYTALKEYKTGQEKWSKQKVDKDDQITFYAMGCYLITKKVPNDLELVHVETKVVDEVGRIEATGEIYRHPTTRNLGDVLEMIVRCRKAWKGINKLMESELL